MFYSTVKQVICLCENYFLSEVVFYILYKLLEYCIIVVFNMDFLNYVLT